MKTLRGLFSDLPLGGYDFLQEYGSWRVAEGEMVSKGDVWVNVVQGDGSKLPVAIGRRGAHVKLIIPPEEKEGTVIALTRAGADRLIAEAQARADRYKKALREILAFPGDEPCEVASARWRIAREALDEKA